MNTIIDRLRGLEEVRDEEMKGKKLKQRSYVNGTHGGTADKRVDAATKNPMTKFSF